MCRELYQVKYKDQTNIERTYTGYLEVPINNSLIHNTRLTTIYTLPALVPKNGPCKRKERDEENAIVRYKKTNVIENVTILDVITLLERKV
jgi:hypothetical protein